MIDDSEQAIDDILERFDTDQKLMISEAYGDGGTSALFARLRRAAINQADKGNATVSRYAIWANTARDHISSAVELMQTGNQEDGLRLLTLAHNSLSAFAEVQRCFDPIYEE